LSFVIDLLQDEHFFSAISQRFITSVYKAFY